MFVDSHLLVNYRFYCDRKCINITVNPEKTIKIKTKNLLGPWITKGLVKSSNKKHKLYNKYLKHKTYKNECNYKTYKQLFETLKKQSKNMYYAKQLKNCRSNINPIHAGGGGGRIPPRSYNFYCQFFKNGHVMLIFRHF